MEMQEMTYREAIRLAMSEEMRRDSDVIFMGEDIGVYGGGFGVSFVFIPCHYGSGLHVLRGPRL